MTYTNSPSPAWLPTPDVVQHANLTKLIETSGFETFDELHQWSVSDPDAFWGGVIDDLSLAFETPPVSIRGSRDVTRPDWLPGASFNIVASCLDHGDDAVAVITGSADGAIERTTIAELRVMVAAFAEGFHLAGFTQGDRIAIVMPMTLEAVVAYLGTIAAGGVVVSIADSFAPREINSRFVATAPVAVVTQDEAVRLGSVLPMYQKCVDAEAPRCIVVQTGADMDLRHGDWSWSDFLVADAPFVPVMMQASSHTNILFSSGTTGDPKAIPWSQTPPIKAAMDGRYHQDIHQGDVVAWPTNLGWVMGPWLIYAALLNGAAMALYEDAPTTRGFVQFVQEAGVTMLGTVPSIVAAWKASGVLAPGDMTTVRVLSSTGEASSPADYRWLMDTAGGIPVIEYCGGTEVGGGYMAGTVLHQVIPSRFPGPTLGMDLVILDEDGNEADDGEVFLVPPSIGLSVELLNRDHTAEYFEGVPDTGTVLRRHGDQVRRDADGFLQALGRVDDTMNIGGIKVSSADLEAAIGDIEGVSEVATIASVPPGGGPSRLVVFVVGTQDVGLDVVAVRSEMQGALRSRLNPLFKIHEVVVVDALPRTASHKVMRRSLRAAYDR